MTISLSSAEGGRRGRLARWFLSYSLYGVPQAAGPIAFALIALPLTGNASSGAAIVMVMTIAQIVGAVPLARLGSRYNAVSFLRVLILFRTAGLIMITVLAASGGDFYWILAVAALSGLVNGAAYAYLRALLNYLVDPPRLLSALGIGTTLTEIVYVLAPPVASVLALASPPLALGIVTLIGAAPLLLIPRIPHAAAPAKRGSKGGLITPPIALWLYCSFAGGAAVGVIEVGSVIIAVDFGLTPALGVIFTIALCLAAVAGGTWVSFQRGPAARYVVPACLVMMFCGAALVAMRISVEVTGVGCVLVGLTMVPLSAHYSIILDSLAPEGKRAELFALLRTANSLGVILASAALAWATLSIALAAGAVLLAGASVAVLTLMPPNRR
jgi:hypothetical protein